MAIIWDKKPEPIYALVVTDEFVETTEADDELPQEKSPCQESGKGFGK